MRTIAHIKIDPQVKNKAKILAKDLGFSLSAVITAQLKQFIRDQRLSVGKTAQMSDYLEKLLGPIESDLRRGKNMSKIIKTNSDLQRYFDSV